MTTLFVKDLTVIDFSYFNNQRGLLGESWIMDIELSGELNAIGFIFDFGKVKKTIKTLVDSQVDHKCVVPSKSKQISIQEEGDSYTIKYVYPDKKIIELHSPKSAFCFFDFDEVTLANMENYLETLILKALPSNISNIKVHLREEVLDSDYYHYSHGLKKHDGNCQRIAHGHRSKIEIAHNGERVKSLEAAWAKKFEDCYIGTEEDLNSVIILNKIDYNVFEYSTNQGFFKLTIPIIKCILISEESSVENIAHYIAKTTVALTDLRPIEVRAFEGVGKGAVASI